MPIAGGTLCFRSLEIIFYVPQRHDHLLDTREIAVLIPQ